MLLSFQIPSLHIHPLCPVLFIQDYFLELGQHDEIYYEKLDRDNYPQL